MLKTQILHNGQIEEGSFSDLGQKHATVWVDVPDPSADELELAARHIEGEREELSEFLHPQQRPLLADIGKFTTVVFHAPEIREGVLSIRPHVLLVSKEQKDFLTLHEGTSPAIERIGKYSNKRRVEIFQKGSTTLLFAVLNEMVAGGFEILDYISEETNKLEEQVFEPHLATKVMQRIFRLKKDLIYFQRSLAADREVISEIEKAYGQFLDLKQLSSFRLLYSDITQLIELSTTYRDIIISTLEIHLAAISNNLNVVMKRLTAWAAIILVPSLIAGIYGMNFAVLPFAHHPFGFWLAVGAMAISVWALYGYFKRHDWI